jgi:hypothetical protein
MIRFIYAGDRFDRDRELVVTNIINIVSTLIDIPEYIEVEFRSLKSLYGELLLDPRFKSRLRLEETLSSKEIIIPLIHELIHLNQVHAGRLKASRIGIYWDGKFHNMKNKEITPEVWANFPWERDVAQKQQKLLENVLKIGLEKG